MRHCALSLRLPVVAAALSVASIALRANDAGAVSIPVVEYPNCDPLLGWRCFSTENTYLTTTFDQPDGDWTVTPILPEDPENWRLIAVSAQVNGSITYQFVFPTPGLTDSATLDEVSFVDASGRMFFATSLRLLGAFCFEATGGSNAGKTICSEGNSIAAGASFGEIALPGAPHLDPLLPSLDGPIRIHVDWTILGTDVPEASSLRVPVYFAYVFAPVPEPSTAVLVMTGLLGLAYQTRRSRVGRPLAIRVSARAHLRR